MNIIFLLNPKQDPLLGSRIRTRSGYKQQVRKKRYWQCGFISGQLTESGNV